MDKTHLVFDVADATESEKDELKTALEIAMKDVLSEAFQCIERGEFHGCAYVHLEIAAIRMQEFDPCDHCSSELPDPPKGQAVQ